MKKKQKRVVKRVIGMPGMATTSLIPNNEVGLEIPNGTGSGKTALEN